MAHYTVQSSSGQNQKLFRICGYGLMVLMLLFLGVSRTNWINDHWSHPLGWTGGSLLVLALIGVPVLILKDSMNKLWQNVSFDIVENKIVRVMEGQAPIEFPLDKISFIGESRTGLTVRGGEPPQSFVIPRAVKGFEELKRQLSDHCEIVPAASTNSFFRIFPLILIIALYVLLLTAKSRSLVLTAGAAALLFQGWIIFGMRRTWAKTSSPKLVVSAFMLSWLVLLWLVYERFSSTL
jgi:hypothetical protein